MLNWKNYNRYNNILGWAVFVIATMVYLLTMGHTASLWDCAEFIACDYKLEIGHPPGAPFYMLIYNVATHLAPNKQMVALFANAVSCILSGFTILFLFWTITHMVRRTIAPHFNLQNYKLGTSDTQLDISKAIIIYGAGLIGALAYTFSDTFWFSAIEAEVYAFSSFFTAIVFWLIFVWDERSYDSDSDRYIILIAYMMGLSIGVHLLNLLCIPAMSLVVLYAISHHKKSMKKWQFIGTILLSFLFIAILMFGVIQGVPKVAGWFDFFAVNTLGWAVNSGLYCYLILLAILLTLSVVSYARKDTADPDGSQTPILSKIYLFLSFVLLGVPFMGGVFIFLVMMIVIGLFVFRAKVPRRYFRLIQMCLIVIMIGYSSYGVIIVRAVADPPMNEDAPADAFSLRSYLAREQYGSTPLLWGPTFVAQVTGVKNGKTSVSLSPRKNLKSKPHYIEQPTQEYTYDKEDMLLFTRCYDRSHAQSYNSWMNRAPNDMSKVTMLQNIGYALTYQINYMYWRYFLWNFSGRQNDLQGDGGPLRGNAITGIPIIDNHFLGDQSKLPSIYKNNKGHNTYFMLPLLLGLIGIFFQVLHGKRSLQQFWITLFLFLMTGLAIIAYLNQYPDQPRERDYAYAGSFYAFCIWIGFGVVGVWYMFKSKKLFKGKEKILAIVTSLVLLLIPLRMASQNWDDHDRSTRSIARDIAIDYLESCDPNAILFCYGDNDTFPLWYAQEVEGIRTDVRACNLSYLTGSWYIDQMHKDAYTSKRLPFEYMTPSLYYNTSIAYLPDTKALNPILLNKGLKEMQRTGINTGEAILPSNILLLPVDSARMQKHLDNIDSSLYHNRALSTMVLSLQGKKYIDAATMSILDIINKNDWKRPIYWNITSPHSQIPNIGNYLTQVGMQYRLLPVDLSVKDSTNKYTIMGNPMMIDKTYNVVMNKFKWCGANIPTTYFDENCRNMVGGLRNSVVAPLAIALVNRGDTVRARKVLNKCLKSILPECVPYTFRSIEFIRALYLSGMQKEADAIAQKVGQDLYTEFVWYNTPENAALFISDNSKNDMYRSLYFTYQLYLLCKSYHSHVLDKEGDALQKYVGIFAK